MQLQAAANTDDLWRQLMLLPDDYSHEALHNQKRRELMAKIGFEHGGASYDEKYPDGIPTSVVIKTKDGGGERSAVLSACSCIQVARAGKEVDSGLIMYPAGHARNTTADLEGACCLAGCGAARASDGAGAQAS